MTGGAGGDTVRAVATSGDDGDEAGGGGVIAPPGRDVRGALGGSRLDRRPELAEELARLRDALARPGPRLLEIGFDHGRRLSATAAASPTWTVVGLEVREQRVLEARARAAEHGLDNLVALRLDARAILASPDAVPEGAFTVVEALFPTPWPEGKARRRLLATPDFFRDAARALAPGGLLYLATDVAWLADAMAASAGAAPELEATPWEEALRERRPPCSQRSRREWRCAEDGLPVHRFAFVRRGWASQRGPGSS
ncbi:MAG: hypothetical protein H6745_03195 [Deltaproteobacteria bacterium]|nr:hypothetical protein [Deltaproteobacteria bacterium]